ncbi:hypothetical protein [Pseudomonas syringae]|uniref:hypothetical protein n=1 Tax=Pseudomonas syringae TaxID=317 RepID=UPI0012682963|nr:hypothetical protein [Pseudomonas syringae]
MPLPITPQQYIAIDKLHRKCPEISELILTVAHNFNENAVENPEFAMIILEALGKRAVAGEQEAVTSLTGHLENFGRLGCLTSADVIKLSMLALQIELPAPNVPIKAYYTE